jgi:hypothetical protein
MHGLLPVFVIVYCIVVLYALHVCRSLFFFFLNVLVLDMFFKILIYIVDILIIV